MTSSMTGGFLRDDTTGALVVSGGTGGGTATDAASVTVTPAGGIASTDVQAALEELDTEKAGATDLSTHEADTTSVHGIADTSLLLVGDGSITDVVQVT